MSFAFGLAVTSVLIWGVCVDRQPAPLGSVLRLAALALVVAWTHLLVWLFRRMSCREVSAGYCAVVFFGAWAVFFLIYNCLV
jgi:hypothetical protein